MTTMLRTAKTLLSARPGIVIIADTPVRCGLRLLQLADHFGWDGTTEDGTALAIDELIKRAAAAGNGRQRNEDPALDEVLIDHGRAAFAWLAVHAVPADFELLDCGENTIVLVPEGPAEDQTGLLHPWTGANSSTETQRGLR